MTDAATAIAHPNIALIKYWGKRDSALNLPAAGSVSITLDTLFTRTRVTSGGDRDRFILNGQEEPDRSERIVRFVNRLRELGGRSATVEIVSENNFPTAAGLASSASGFAALAVALNEWFGLGLDAADLSRYARMGSGSAARSIFGGFVQMHAGQRPDGSDAVAEPLAEPSAWPLKVVVAITSRMPKAAGSTGAMEASRRTSPFYPAWVAETPADIDAARTAIERRDFERLAEVSEHSCLKMHATMLATRPPLIYWNPATVDALHAVRELRASGTAVFFTVDAGPQVKAVCLPDAAEKVAQTLAAVPGVEDTVVTGLGQGARPDAS